MSIADRWHSRLTSEMARKQNQRADEVGGHSYLKQVDRYGLQILFAEMANIMSRLEMMLWVNNPQDAMRDNPDRLMDLLADMGNYTSFMYEAAFNQIRNLEELGLMRNNESDDDSPWGENPGNISSTRERQES